MNTNERKRKPNHTWTWPIILGVTSASGLISALVADGWADAMSWFGLGLPVLIACVYGLRRQSCEQMQK